MGSDELQLIATGKEPDEDHGVTRVANRAAQDLPQRFVQLCAGRTRIGAHYRQHQQDRQDHGCENHEDCLPGKQPQQPLRQWRADHLPERACRRHHSQRHGAVFVARRAPDYGQNQAESRARNAESDEDFQQVVLAWGHGKARQDQPGRIAECAENDRLAITEPLSNCGKDRLAESPGEALDCNGEGERTARPAEILGDRDLEHAEGRPDRHAGDDDRATCEQDRGD